MMKSQKEISCHRKPNGKNFILLYESFMVYVDL